MGRSKLLSDGAVLGRLLTQLERVGPGGLTFAKASEAAGLSAASLVQRFGARDAMVEAVLLHAWDRLDAATAAADAEAPATPAGAIDLLLRLLPGDASGCDVTDGLLLLREDFRNPRLCARGAAWGSTLASALGRRLTTAPGDADRLGWQMASIWQGAIIWSAFRRESDAGSAIGTALEEWCHNVGALTP
ncbi:MAG: TetR family transcriptional regulator [Sphingopyxis sp. RIFCSPHIGHO2_01_FULL_65_24]|nr:MAG: TetR family transcriptional regulator [Sphingopyxis sp. RIFCSPHIGHO2_01_FULL_65_24]